MSASRHVPYCVCVPARNEAAKLPIFLAALASQDLPKPATIVIALNNTTDSSRAVIDAAGRRFGDNLRLIIDEYVFESALSHVGSARRRAMDIGADLVGGSRDAVLLTTDADTRPPPMWIRENLRAINDYRDIIGGRLVIDERERLPAPVRAARELWDNYWTLVRAIEDATDPRPHDPAPRHGDHTGGSLALTADLYRSAGGVPIVPFNEDHGLVKAALVAGGRLKHPMSVWTRVSPRRDGRARGGMADAMTDLFNRVAEGEIICAPSLVHWQSRALWRRDLRRLPNGNLRIAQEEPLLPPMPHDVPLADIVSRALRQKQNADRHTQPQSDGCVEFV